MPASPSKISEVIEESSKDVLQELGTTTIWSIFSNRVFILGVKPPVVASVDDYPGREGFSGILGL